jgi:hypothetical protein
MTVIEPAKPKHKFEDLGDTLRFTIPNPKSWPLIIFCCIWLLPPLFLVGFGLFLLFFPGKNVLFTGTSADLSLLWLIPYFGIWVGVPLFALLWQLTGKEVIVVTRQSICLKWSIAGIGRSAEYPAGELQNLRVIANSSRPPWLNFLSRQIRNLFIRKVTFNYKGKEKQFAGLIDEAEARQIIETVQRRFSAYGALEHKLEPEPQLKSPRLEIDSEKDLVRVKVPSRKSMRAILLPLCFVAGLTMIFLFAAYEIGVSVLMGDPGPGQSFELTWISVLGSGLGFLFVGFIVFAFAANWLMWLYQLLWPLIGYEIIELDSNTLTLRYKVGPYQWVNKFDGQYLSNFQAAVLPGDHPFPAPINTLNNGLVAFDYGAKTYYCGDGADNSEARQIVSLIQQRFPQYR